MDKAKDQNKFLLLYQCNNHSKCWENTWKISCFFFQPIQVSKCYESVMLSWRIDVWPIRTRVEYQLAYKCRHLGHFVLFPQESSGTEQRIKSLKSSLQSLVYEYVCRSLFKVRLVFLLCLFRCSCVTHAPLTDCNFPRFVFSFSGWQIDVCNTSSPRHASGNVWGKGNNFCCVFLFCCCCFAFFAIIKAFCISFMFLFGHICMAQRNRTFPLILNAVD